MTKRQKVLMTINIIVLIILANIKWNSDILIDNRNYESDFIALNNWKVNFENPPNVSNQEIIIDMDKKLSYDQENSLILSSFNAKEECNDSRPIYKILAKKYGNQIEYSRIMLKGNYPNIYRIDCMSDKQAEERNKKMQDRIDELKLDRKIYEYLNHGIIFFMIIQVGLILWVFFKNSIVRF